MLTLLNQLWIWVTLLLPINNKSCIGLICISSIFILCSLSCRLDSCSLILNSVVEFSSVFNYVSELGYGLHVQSLLPTLAIPAFLTEHKGLGTRQNVDKMRYLYDHVAVIYGIVCETTNMIYVGSTWDSVRRFNKHFISKDMTRQNADLQADIEKYGMDNFTVYIFTKVTIDRRLTLAQKELVIRTVEQGYINMFPKDQQYNSINSLSKRK